MVVIKGPEATAGSTPKRYKVMGIAAPVRPEIAIAKHMARPTQAAVDNKKETG